MDLSIFFLGTGGSTPSAHRGLPATLVRRGGENLLFDCGEGTQRQMMRSVGLCEIDRIYITHLHADHWLGLPGMLKSFGLRERERPLRICGPSGLAQLLASMRVVYGRLPYELEIVELEPMQREDFDGYGIVNVPVRHRVAVAYGYVLAEDVRPGQFDPEAAARLGVSPGPLFGRLQRGESVGDVRPEQVLGPPRAGRKLVLSGDTAPCEAVRVAAHEADVLVHEATFMATEAQRAAETQHSTATAAAKIGREAEVKLLALTHISSRYGGGEVQREARAVLAATEVPRDFDAIEVPFPERGTPRLVRWAVNPANARSIARTAVEGEDAGDRPAPSSRADSGAGVATSTRAGSTV